MASDPHVRSVTTMIGERVRNEENTSFGKIEDLMIDLESGRVAYAVLSFGGFLGMGSKLFAMPLEVLRFDDATKEFVLRIDREVLEDSAGFDRNNWPEMP